MYCGPHWIVIPCILHHEMGNELLPIGPGQSVFTRPHPIKQLTDYRLWNPVSRQNDGLIRRDVSSNTVTCNGSFNGGKDSKLLHQYYVQNKVKVTYPTFYSKFSNFRSLFAVHTFCAISNIIDAKLYSFLLFYRALSNVYQNCKNSRGHPCRGKILFILFMLI